MLTLYYKPSCAFSRRVKAVTDRLGLEVEMKDINEADIANELIEKGGKKQVPYFIDTEHEVAMYESDDIVSHLQTKYGKTDTSARPRIHINDNTCVSCEG